MFPVNIILHSRSSTVSSHIVLRLKRLLLDDTETAVGKTENKNKNLFQQHVTKSTFCLIILVQFYWRHLLGQSWSFLDLQRSPLKCFIGFIFIYRNWRNTLMSVSTRQHLFLIRSQFILLWIHWMEEVLLHFVILTNFIFINQSSLSWLSASNKSVET